MTSIRPYLANVYPININHVSAIHSLLYRPCLHLRARRKVEDRSGPRPLQRDFPDAQMHEKINRIGYQISQIQTDIPPKTKPGSHHLFQLHIVGTPVPYAVYHQMQPYIRAKAKTSARTSHKLHATMYRLENNIARNAKSKQPN